MGENNNLKKCSSCEADIAKSAKVCPKCGAKQKKPIYKRGWFVVIIIVCVIGVISSMGNSSNSESAQSENNNVEKSQKEQVAIEYTPCTVDELEKALDENALKAEKTYKNMYVELTGKIDVIDSSGNYIGLGKLYDQWAIRTIRCDVTNDKQVDDIMEMSSDAKVVLRGKITAVGEIMGYSLDIDEIVSY